MADFKPRPGTFRPYLEYANREKLGQREPASPLTLLEILAGRALLSLPLFELQTRSGMEPSRFGDALKNLHSAGYIGIGGDPAAQIVTLTESGMTVAQLARPA